MLKHETLILTMAAVQKIEEKLLFHLNRSDAREVERKFHYSFLPKPPVNAEM